MPLLPERIPDHWGPKYEGDGCGALRIRTGPDSMAFTASAHMALVMFSPQPDRQVALNNDRPLTGFAPVGSLEIIPIQSSVFARWPVDIEELLVAVEPERLENLAQLELGTDTFQLESPRIGYVDKKALNIARLIRDELLLDVGANEDCLDSLLTIFQVHLLRNYSASGRRRWQIAKGGLRPQRLRRVNDYIRAHIGEKITIEQMAEVAQMSPSHFIRAFRETTGLPPHQFLILARLAHARHLIAATKTPLEEIARMAGFHSNSHMTATMKRIWSIKPSIFRSGSDCAPPLPG